MPDAKVEPGSEFELYDLMIVGGGPAGTTAAVYSCRKKLKTLMITLDLGGQVLTTSDIENYTGFQYVTGQELTAKFDAQIRQFPLALTMPARVERLEAQESGASRRGFVARTEQGKTYHSRTVIVATGAHPRQLNVPGERELNGRGVTYCATCDAPLYAGRSVAVVGGGNSALTSLLDLASQAKTVYAVNSNDRFKGDEVLIEKVNAASNIRQLLEHDTVSILGSERVTAIDVRSRRTDRTERFEVDGVFIEIGLVPNSDLAAKLLELNPAREIIVNSRNETSVPGIYAAGDVTNVTEKQIIVAAGEGAKAALGAYNYLLLQSPVGQEDVVK